MSSSRDGLDNSRLLDFLSVLDDDLRQKVTLIAVGGTGMTLINAKASTLDVDFTIPDEHYAEFERAYNLNKPGFRVDLFQGGTVFTTNLPDDYLEKTIEIKTDFKNIDLRALNPSDIVMTKISRMNARDIEDIEACIKKFSLTKEMLESRAKQIVHPANEEQWQESLKRVISEFCS